jgi:hypothetical protein
MGNIHVTVNLSYPGSNIEFEDIFVIDMVSMNSMAPGNKLKAIGFKPYGKVNYNLDNEEIVTYEFTLAEIRFMGDYTGGRVILGPDDCEPILGLTALESVGITIDPANRTLKRLPAIPLK